MKNMDRLSVRGKVLTAAAIAFFILSIASPANADSTRWRTIVGIIQANNPVAGYPRRRAAMDDTWWSRSC